MITEHTKCLVLTSSKFFISYLDENEWKMNSRAQLMVKLAQENAESKYQQVNHCESYHFTRTRETSIQQSIPYGNYPCFNSLEHDEPTEKEPDDDLLLLGDEELAAELRTFAWIQSQNLHTGTGTYQTEPEKEGKKTSIT